VMPNSSSTWWEAGSQTPGHWSQPGIAAFKFEHDMLEFAWVLEPIPAKTASNADGMIPGEHFEVGTLVNCRHPFLALQMLAPQHTVWTKRCCCFPAMLMNHTLLCVSGLGLHGAFLLYDATITPSVCCQQRCL